MTINQRKARGKLLRIMPREVLERMVRHERPHMLSMKQLVELAIEHWDTSIVYDELQRILRRADPEGTQP
jgi:hypothetical protein